MFKRGVAAATKQAIRVGKVAVARAVKSTIDQNQPPKGVGDWIPGVVVGPAGARQFRLYRPPALQADERLPLIVMLHGCAQDAKSFATSTRMNQVAARERFFVLYPEQDRLANPQGCWNWFDTRTGRADGEAELIMKAVDQVTRLYPIAVDRVAVAGLSAGASIAALLVTRHPERFKAVVMHSGIAPGEANSTLSALAAMRGRRSTLARAPAVTASNWPPLLVIHGGIDRVVAASNGEAAVAIWADAQGAAALPQRQVQRGKRYPMSVTDFKCKGRTVASLVEVARLGHAWSGGAVNQAFSDSQGPDASRMVWAFAARQFRA
jgi:poly(hydroxyalkanoate) depolymerase family esterase